MSKFTLILLQISIGFIIVFSIGVATYFIPFQSGLPTTFKVVFSIAFAFLAAFGVKTFRLGQEVYATLEKK